MIENIDDPEIESNWGKFVEFTPEEEAIAQ